jgi:GTPase
VLDAADGAGVSWLHRHTEVIHKAVDADSGRTVMTVRADAGKAEAVRARFQNGEWRIANGEVASGDQAKPK